MGKGLEALKKLVFHAEYEMSADGFAEWRNSKEIVEKELKAFDVIKNKRVDVDLFLTRRHILTNNNPKDFTEKEYCDDLNFFLSRGVGIRLTQEEYDLLREVLL